MYNKFYIFKTNKEIRIRNLNFRHFEIQNFVILEFRKRELCSLEFCKTRILKQFTEKTEFCHPEF